MEKKEERNILEKITFITGSITLLLLFSFLAFQIIYGENKPPELFVTLLEEKSSGNGRYKVQVENKGQETATTTRIVFDLYQEGKVAAKAELQIDYVPINSKEEGWIVFPGQESPADSIVINSLSYLEP